MAAVREEFEAVMSKQPLWQSLTPWELWVLASKAMQERCANWCEAVEEASYGAGCSDRGSGAMACKFGIRSINTNE